MKAKVIETGEIIEVKSLYSPVYSRLDCNGKVIEEYNEDELEFIPNPNRPKMVSLDKVCNFIRLNAYKYRQLKFVKNKATFDFRTDRLIEDLRKAMEE